MTLPAPSTARSVGATGKRNRDAEFQPEQKDGPLVPGAVFDDLCWQPGYYRRLCLISVEKKPLNWLTQELLNTNRYMSLHTELEK